jgi:hypothetical protein
VVQHGVAPDAVKAGVGEGQPFAGGLEEADAHAVGPGVGSSLGDVPGGQVEGGDPSAAAGQDHGGHAVAAAVVEHVQAADVTEPGQGRPKPGLVIEVSVVAEEEGGGIGPEGG